MFRCRFVVVLSCFIVLQAFTQIGAFAQYSQKNQVDAPFKYDTSLLKILRPPYSVADYFLLLPESLFQYEGKTRPFDTKSRRLILQSGTSDSSRMNGVDFFLGALETYKTFLVINTPESDKGTSFSVAQWTYKPTPQQGKKPVSKPLIGWCKRRWTAQGSTSEVRFFIFEQNSWQDITTRVFTPVPMTEFFQWSGFKKLPNLKPPVDYELARSEQAIIGRLDMQLLAKMPELEPIRSGLERNTQIRTVEMRLKDSIFVVTNKY
jgi:hypothetical protein